MPYNRLSNEVVSVVGVLLLPCLGHYMFVCGVIKDQWDFREAIIYTYSAICYVVRLQVRYLNSSFSTAAFWSRGANIIKSQCREQSTKKAQLN